MRSEGRMRPQDKDARAARRSQEPEEEGRIPRGPTAVASAAAASEPRPAPHPGNRSEQGQGRAIPVNGNTAKEHWPSCCDQGRRSRGTLATGDQGTAGRAAARQLPCLPINEALQERGCVGPMPAPPAPAPALPPQQPALPAPSSAPAEAQLAPGQGLGMLSPAPCSPSLGGRPGHQ